MCRRPAPSRGRSSARAPRGRDARRRPGRPELERRLAGAGEVRTASSAEALLRGLRDTAVLGRAIPGVEGVQRLGGGRFAARIGFGVGPLVAVYEVRLILTEDADRCAVAVGGDAAGRFGQGRARGELRMTPLPRGGARLAWTFEGVVSGPVARVGARLLHAASERFCRRVGEGLDRELLRLDARAQQAGASGATESRS